MNRGKQQLDRIFFNKFQNPGNWSSCKNIGISSRGLILLSNINQNSCISSGSLGAIILEMLENKLTIRLIIFLNCKINILIAWSFFFLNYKHDEIKYLSYLVAAEYFTHGSLGGARFPVLSSSSAFGMGARSLSPRWASTHKWGSSCYSWRKISGNKAQTG